MLQQYDYVRPPSHSRLTLQYWRVEPGVEFYCDVASHDLRLDLLITQDYDPFVFLQQNNKTYGFTVHVATLVARALTFAGPSTNTSPSIQVPACSSSRRTIQSLWPTVRDFVKLHPEYVAPDNSLGFLVDDLSQGMDARYNLCHCASEPLRAALTPSVWSNFEVSQRHSLTPLTCLDRGSAFLAIRCVSDVLQIPGRHR